MFNRPPAHEIPDGPTDQFLDDTFKTATAIAAMVNKEMVNAEFETGLLWGIYAEWQVFQGLTATEDKAEGIASLCEKRRAS
tara:strand:- start:15623 stop:15865 length:243 start_codon:yes stop_codon:yes gene_type:complete